MLCFVPNRLKFNAAKKTKNALKSQVEVIGKNSTDSNEQKYVDEQYNYDTNYVCARKC